jgi:hypothetical protein
MSLIDTNGISSSEPLEKLGPNGTHLHTPEHLSSTDTDTEDDEEDEKTPCKLASVILAKNAIREEYGDIPHLQEAGISVVRTARPGLSYVAIYNLFMEELQRLYERASIEEAQSKKQEAEICQSFGPLKRKRS